MIKEEFTASLKKYSGDDQLHLILWNEIEKNYSSSNRYYHNLTHLDAMLSELSVHKGKFDSWDIIVFAIAYHDLIYNSLKSNNEERSAELAAKRLSAIAVPKESIDICTQLILATKKHEPADSRTNLFTDADLAILGTNGDAYKEYSKQIRQEYSIYPDLVYNPGRMKVLRHFLEMDSIYKTQAFSDKYERTARTNIQAELSRLD